MDLRVFLKLDGSGFTQGLTSAKQNIGRFGSQTLGNLKSQLAAAFSVGAMTALSRKTLDYAGRLNDLSSRLGVSTDFMQEFQYVAQQTGTELDSLVSVMEKFRDTRDAALSGGPAGAKAMASFGAFGITQADLRTKRIEDLISGPIARAFEAGDVQGKLGAAWRDIGGKSAGQLIAGFTEGFTDLRAQAHAAGRFWSEEQIQIMDQMGDRISIVGQRIVTEWGHIMITLYQMANRLSGKLDSMLNYVVGGTSKWTTMDWLANTAELVDPFGRKIGGKKFDYQTALEAAKQSVGDFKREEADMVAAFERARLLRNKSQLPLSGTFPVMPEAANWQKPNAIGGKPSDSLISVGNFLGASRSTMEGIATETNRLLRDQIRILTIIAQKRGTDNPLGIPSI